MLKALPEAEPCYLVASHEAQVSQGLAALSDLSGSLVCDVFTPAGIHGLYGAAVLANSYQGYGYVGKTERGWRVERDAGGEKQGKVLVWQHFLIQMWQHQPPRETFRKSA